MTTTDRPAPTILGVGIHDERQLNVELDDPLLMESRDGKQFRPDNLFARWSNGRLISCTIHGPRINKDGSRHGRGDRIGVSLMGGYTHGVGDDGRAIAYRPTTLADDAPQWAHELVARYAPTREETA